MTFQELPQREMVALYSSISLDRWNHRLTSPAEYLRREIRSGRPVAAGIRDNGLRIQQANCALGWAATRKSFARLDAFRGRHSTARGNLRRLLRRWHRCADARRTLLRRPGRRSPDELDEGAAGDDHQRRGGVRLYLSGDQLADRRRHDCGVDHRRISRNGCRADASKPISFAS